MVGVELAVGTRLSSVEEAISVSPSLLVLLAVLAAWPAACSVLVAVPSVSILLVLLVMTVSLIATASPVSTIASGVSSTGSAVCARAVAPGERVRIMPQISRPLTARVKCLDGLKKLFHIRM